MKQITEIRSLFIKPAMKIANRTVFFLLLGILAAHLLAVAPTRVVQEANEPSNSQRMWGLVIGVSNYSHAEPLLFAATDAQAFSEFLQSPRGGAIPSDHLITLLEEDATRTRLEYEIYSMTGKVQEGDSVYIFVAGHGLLDKNGIAFFLPSDGNPREPFSTSLNLLAFQQVVTMGFAKAAHRVLITDMCHSGTLADQQNLINDYMAKQFGQAPGGALLNLLASGPNEPSWEDEELGHGVFTYALLEALNGRGVEAEDQQIRAQQLVRFVQKEVPQWTAFQQNPVVNETFDPETLLAFLDRPGPAPYAPDEGTILVLTNGDKSSFVRIQWVDPKTEAITVRKIPKDQSSVPIGPLLPGSLEIALFDSENRVQSITVSLESGQNTLDVAGTQVGRYRFQPAPSRQVASLAFLPPQVPSSNLQQPQVQIDTSQASLILKLDEGTEVFVDGDFYGASTGTERPLQVQALDAGPHLLRLVHSPEHEQRFRIKLFQGTQIFDPQSSELRSLRSLEPPPSFLARPSQLPADQDENYRSFAEAIWEERLVQPEGDNAWYYYHQLEPNLPEDLRESLRKQLVVAMGDRAQSIVLKYLRGGDVRWTAPVFDEGAVLTNRVRLLFRNTPAYESQEHFFRGRALLEEGDYDSALDELRQAVELHSEASQSYNAIGLTYWKQGRPEEALPYLEQSIALTPFWNYPRITRAFIHLEQRLFDEAEQGLRQAIQSDPEDSTAHHALGQIHFLLQRWTEAEEAVNLAVELNPGNAYAYETLGLIHQRLQQFSEAEEAFRLAIRLEPEELSFRVSLAELLRLQGRIPEATSIFADRLAQNRNDVPLLIAYAEFLSRLNRTDAAEGIFQEASNLADRNVELWLKYAVFLRSQERFQEAVQLLNQVLEAEPDNHLAHYQLAEIHFGRKQLSEAERQARESLERNPRYAPPHRLIGQIQFAERQYDEAIASFRKARDLATEAHQQQELQELIEQVENIIVNEQVGLFEVQVQRKRLRPAWKTLATTLQRAPESRELRDLILRFQSSYPDAVEMDQLPASAVTSVLRTGFWKHLIEAESLWQGNRQEEALNRFTSALEALEGEELRVVTSTAFNFRNARFSVHEIISVWCSRLLEQGSYRRVLALLDLSLAKKIFAIVPDYSPTTVNSLMWPADAEPQTLEDFEMAHHGDRRAHELYAAGYAGSGDLHHALQYLEALESQGPDLAARIRVARALSATQSLEDAGSLLREALSRFSLESDPELFVTGTIEYANILCRTGDCPRAREVLEQARRLLPEDKRIGLALRELM